MPQPIYNQGNSPPPLAHEGAYVGSSAVIFQGTTDPETLETFACREALALADDLGVQKHTITQNLFQGEEKKTRKGRMKKGRPFTLSHCYEELKDDEKWKPREGVNEETDKHKRSIDLDDDEEEASIK
ncbi:Tyrosine N-monooxygenase [Hordeum vulgare]|nr:Tyrosine N-monooxygenase [Hordeum vulgare]